MPIASLNTNPSSTIRPSTTSAKQPLWNGRAVERLPSDSSCLTQKELHFSDYIAPEAPETAPTTTHFENVEVLFFEWKPEESDDLLYFTYSPQESDSSQESEWRFADPAPYIPKNDEENLTVEELLQRTGYKFATFEDLETIRCKKVKDRVLGWWKSGVKWAKEHKKILIVTGVVLGTGAFVAGVVLLASAATAEAAVATTAAVGAAVAGGSGPKKKDEEEEKPPAPQETASEPPPPPPFIPSIDFSPPTEKPQPPKETASASPPSRPAELPSIAFQPPVNGKSPSGSYIPSISPSLLPPADFSFSTNTLLFPSDLQSKAKTYSDYIREKAMNPLTPIPSLAMLSPVEKPEEYLYASMRQTIQDGFSYVAADAIKKIEQPNLSEGSSHKSDRGKSDIQPFVPASQAWSLPAFLSVAPIKSAYDTFLCLLASDGLIYPPTLPSEQYPKSCYYVVEGIKHKSTQVSNANGMGNSFEEAYANAKYLQSFTSLQIEGIYNHSNGGIIDFLEIVFLNFAGFSPITEDLIMKKFIDFAEANKDDPQAKCLHPCHSQSAIQTRHALEKLPQEVRDRVIIVNIAGARVIPKRLCFKSFNYVSKKDIVPSLHKYYQGFVIANLSEEEQQEILNQEILDLREIIVLEPHEGATGLDHSFRSPTYAKSLKEILEDYQKRKGRY